MCSCMQATHGTYGAAANKRILHANKLQLVQISHLHDFLGQVQSTNAAKRELRRAS